MTGQDDGLAAERRRVVRRIPRYRPGQKASHIAPPPYYIHPAVPDRGFSTRDRAARAGLAAQTEPAPIDLDALR